MSISPKEVLRAIDAGITLYSSSSMGALRAVECAPYGMTGVGMIYEETGRPVSEPLVNMPSRLRQRSRLA